MDLQVIGRELIIPSTSINIVQVDSSLRLSPWFLSIAEKLLLADWICHSHNLPRITFPTYPWSSQSHQEIIDTFLIHLNKHLLRLNACTNKVGPIVTSDHPKIPPSTDQSSKCLNEAVCYQISCRFDVQCSAG